MLSTFFPLYPRKAISVVLSIANLNLVLTCLTTSQYLSFLFLAMRIDDAKNCLLYVENYVKLNVSTSKIVHSSAVEKHNSIDFTGESSEINSCLKLPVGTTRYATANLSYFIGDIGLLLNMICIPRLVCHRPRNVLLVLH